RFVGSNREAALTGLPEHRHQDQFRGVANAAFELAESSEMAAEVERAYTQSKGQEPNSRAAEIVRMELEAFPLAVDVYKEGVKDGTAKQGARKQLCSSATTILVSVEKILPLNDFGKAGVWQMREAIELSAGD